MQQLLLPNAHFQRVREQPGFGALVKFHGVVPSVILPDLGSYFDDFLNIVWLLQQTSATEERSSTSLTLSRRRDSRATPIACVQAVATGLHV